MATVLFSTAGASAGSYLGPIGGAIGRYVGGSIGGAIDDKIFGPRKLPDYTGPRLADLNVQASSYGKTIPIIFGNMRLAGNVIWSRPIKETANSKKVSSGGKGSGGGKVTQTQTTFEYSISMAIAICEGEIDEIVRVWADAEIIDPTQGTYRIYKGSEEQEVDPFIESFEGVGKAPAYRGLAYVVIEDFPLANYGNRIPNFTFEVKRKVSQVADEVTVEQKVTGVTMIPGSGEFAYDTEIQNKLGGENVGSKFVQNGSQIAINHNNRLGKADALASLDQLKSELPNVEWVSVVAGWFGDNTDAGICVLKPGVEYNSGGTTTPETWSVGSFTRATARLITQIDGSPVYGGTPDDQSLVRYVTELRARGYKILFYPFIFMDVTGKPWRGEITGSVSNVSTFFTKANGYNAFITHYANLLNGKIDAFSIGSEMIGLTKVKDGSNNFPAVSALISLASTVKSILGSSVKVTYAADWSEYHHTDGGWYNMDPLWASPNIDVIGIDAYFPLTDAPQNGYNKQEIIEGWSEGEGYDWYYSDVGRTVKVNLDPKYAWKNIEWWWTHSHVNPNSVTTAWIPGSKKIWFTEFGFPSVDGCANQPNVFYDPNSTLSSFPRFSKGRVDFRAQRVAIEGTLDKWAGSSMVEETFLWTWDARPYPYFPDLRKVWSDGKLWLYGHWVTGKLGLSSLSAIIAEICLRVGLPPQKLQLEQVHDLVDGFVVNTVSPARAALEQLQRGYFFDGIECDGKLKIVMRGNDIAKEISYQKIVPNKNNLLEVKRIQELELPQMVDVNYIDRASNYQVGDQSSKRLITESQGKEIQNLSIVFNEWQAKRIADITLYNAWLSRNTYQFSLPIEYAELDPADIVKITMPDTEHVVRITDMLMGLNGEIKYKAVADDITAYDFYVSANNNGADPGVIKEIAFTQMEILDLPAFPSSDFNEANIMFAATGLGERWDGAGIYRSDDDGANYGQISAISEVAVIGTTASALQDANSNLIDKREIEIILLSGELESVSDLALLNGANVAVIGEEIIQFRDAVLSAEGKYKISGLLRGRLGTEHKTSGHVAAERFILIDSSLAKESVSVQMIGLSRKYKAVSFGKTLSSVPSVDFTYTGNALKPYSPVHITGNRDGSGNLTINWVRRTRIGGEMRDGIEIPLSEELEKYEIDIYDGSNIVRTINVLTPAAIYSAAQQVTDFGFLQPSVDIRIYQISAIVGRGNPGIKTI